MVLIYSETTDATTSEIVAWLKMYKCKVLRLNGDENRFKLVRINFDPDEIIVSDGRHEINLLDAKSVWYRRRGISWNFLNLRIKKENIGNILLEKDQESYIRTNLFNEANVLLDYIFYKLEQGRTLLSSYFNSNINKLYVLDIAQKAGFKIPSTCVLHDKNDIANYIKTHQEVITKALSNGIYNFAVQKAYYTYTEKITLQDISNIDRELFFSLFQQQIVKKYEIRTFYFDNNCYSMAIFSQNDERTTIDFRKSTNNRQNRHIPYKLPVAIEDKIKNLMNSIGLTTGSIDTIFFEMFLNIQKQPFQMLLDNAEQQEKETIIQIKNFIIDNELGFFTDNPSLFPSLECIWDSPFMIHNSIIDIKNTPHDYDLIFKQLRELGCQHIQLRFFSLCTIPELEDLLGIIQKYSFLSIEFIIQYQIDIENDLEDFMKKHLVIRNLFVMSSPYNKKIDVNYEDISSSTLMFLKQPLNSCESCGKINMKTFIPPNIQDFFENKLFRDAKKITYNGYL